MVKLSVRKVTWAACMGLEKGKLPIGSVGLPKRHRRKTPHIFAKKYLRGFRLRYYSESLQVPHNAMCKISFCGGIMALEIAICMVLTFQTAEGELSKLLERAMGEIIEQWPATNQGCFFY